MKRKIRDLIVRHIVAGPHKRTTPVASGAIRLGGLDDPYAQPLRDSYPDAVLTGRKA